MKNFEHTVDFLLKESENLGIHINTDLFIEIAKGLGPALYQEDASLVSSSDPKEIETIKEHFLKKKLGITSEQAMNAAIAEVIDQLGDSNRKKYRLIFYYLLVEHFGKSKYQK
jgi:hypothetical protein